ncbi:hypothetical protein BC834DRAFT_865212 [Gloeopeniophorella convolvens]|nr:hypothetical protein BC834DRAFT_865212 [Gloeopeniophorella convolvens]
MSWARLTHLQTRAGRYVRPFTRRCLSDSAHKPFVETDDCAIPLKPTWSVDDLLSSYPRPVISPSALHRLHGLAALVPPPDGTPEHAKLTNDLEDLVKLVESVKLVNVSAGSGPTDTVLDARVWAEDTGTDLQKSAPKGDSDHEALGREELLSRATRTENGFYLVHSDRARKK